LRQEFPSSGDFRVLPPLFWCTAVLKKKRKTKRYMCRLGMPRIGVFVLLGCMILLSTCEQINNSGADPETPGPNIPEVSKVQTGIRVASPPATLIYGLDQEFNPAGLEVVRVYDDDSEDPLSAGDYTLSQPNMGLPILQEVTVRSGGFRDSFYIQVLIINGVFEDIELVSPPAKLSYYLGEFIDPAGMVVNAVYSDGSRVPVGAYVLTGYDRFKRGTQTVSVTANNRIKTFEADFRVSPNAPGWLNFYKAHWTLPTENQEVNWHRMAYVKGEPFDFEKFNLKAMVQVMVDGVLKTIVLSPGDGLYPEDVEVPDFSTPGTKMITVNLDEKSLTTTVLVFDMEPEVYFDYGYWRHSLEPHGWGKNMTGDSLGDGTYTVSLGRSLVLAPVRVFIGYNQNHESVPVSYTWTVSGGSYDTTAPRDGEFFTFTPTEAGKTYTVSVTASGPTYLGTTVSKTAETKVQCFALPATPPPVVDSPRFSMENTTAPIRNFGPGQFNRPGSNGYMWSLGSALGYETWKLRKTREQDTFEIRGNAFGDGGENGWMEPGIVWVSMDENQDGLPNDTWYELKGSDDENPAYRDLVTRRYAIRHGGGYWADNKGRTGKTPAQLPPIGLPSGFTYESGWVTYTGTLIRDNGNFTNGYRGIGYLPWGYVDASVFDFHISHAIQQDGTPADLPWIDFVKVQTAVFRYGGVFGEVSTEIYSAEGLGKQTDFPLPEES
jgi:hypothetical protein